MAPNFLSKLVKTRDHDRNSSSHSRGSSSFGSSASSSAHINEPRQRVLSSPGPTPSINIHSISTSEFGQRRSHDVEGSSTKSSHLSGSQPSVTVIPPSPQSHVGSFPSSSREGSVNDRPTTSSSNADDKDKRRPQPVATTTTTTTNGSTDSEDALPTPTPHGRSDTGAHRPLTPSSSTGNLRSRIRARSRSFTRSRESSPKADVRRAATMSRKDAERPPLPPPPPPPALGSPPSSANRARSATSPAPSQSRQTSETSANGHAPNSPASSTISGLPVVDSPTYAPSEYLDSPSLASAHSATLTNQPAAPAHAGVNPALLSPTGQRDADAASIISTASTRKRRLWQRKDKDKDGPPSPASPKRRPTALASALAASGIAMANPGASVPQFENVSPTTPPSPPARHPTRNGSINAGSVGSAYRHTPRSSVDVGRTRQGSLTVPEAGDSESVYLSGSAGEDEDDEDDSDDMALLDDLNADDIPVTGFAVASNKRNADFHELFQSIPEGDYLIEDYGCALQREILIQGRIYISENHICFHANIFGWITDLIIPIYEILSLEKKMTAFVIPNALQITTRNAKYTFASFLARDTVYDVIYNIWRLARPEDAYDEGDDDDDENMPGGLPAVAGANGDAPAAAAPVQKKTTCQCGKAGEHYSETAMEAVFPGTPERIYNLMFASGFIKDFMRIDQKLDDIQISDWTPSAADPKCLTRNMSYIKPLNGSIGPRQTKCEIRDETIHCDFEDYVTTITTTRTPDVPSGGVFAVKTRTCIMWASAMSTRVVVTTQVEWTGRSFIKGIIEKSAIDGQKTYHGDLDRGMRAYIKEHQSEFVPAGVDLAVVEAAQPASAPGSPSAAEHAPLSAEEARKSREKERNARGLQWAYDTVEGAYGVARRSTSGALELVRDAWDQSGSATVLWFVITFLVLSNLWTLMLVGRREEAGRRKELRRMEEREKWVQGIVTTLWDELAAGKMPQHAPGVQLPAPARADGSWREEVAEINKVLDLVDERVQTIRRSLQELD